MKKRILTGLKPTGELTLGNYIGAIDPLIKLQSDKDNEIFLFVADLHALTIYQDPDELRQRIKRFIAMYVACGIDPEKTKIYIQSENEYIPVISWILECNTPYGEASRMIQFKEKSKQNASFSVGLLTYPVLMAADILFCDADYVPVGVDQNQHVEFARDLAIRFNNLYGETFTIPKSLVTQVGTKIKDLRNPNKKMSKSEDSPMGVISLFDDEKSITKKIMSATTDSENKVKFDEENKPGISNLLNIASIMSGRSVEEISKEYANCGYGNFKKYVASVTCSKLGKIQDKYKKLINSDEIEAILKKGNASSRRLAKKKCELMKQRVGLK